MPRTRVSAVSTDNGTFFMTAIQSSAPRFWRFCGPVGYGHWHFRPEVRTWLPSPSAVCPQSVENACPSWSCLEKHRYAWLWTSTSLIAILNGTTRARKPTPVPLDGAKAED